MMLVQHQPQTPEAPLPTTDNIHATVNSTASPSILQVGKSRWSAAATAKPASTPTSRASTPASSKSTSPSFTIRPASAADAEQIRSIGSSVFAATFGFSIPPADLSAYLRTSYSLAAIQAELAAPSHHFVVACPPDRPAHVLGFAQVTEHTTEPCLSHLPSGSFCELQRLYVRPECHGKGVGKALTRAGEALARETGYGYMWLGVWEGNFVAQTVYESAGFVRAGEHEFTMGKCVQIDWIMVKEL